MLPGDGNFSHNSLFYQVPSISSEKLALPRLARCKLSRIPRHALAARTYRICRTPPNVWKKQDSKCLNLQKNIEFFNVESN